MPRIRADDYEDKKNSILDAAARLFGENGYFGCKMQDIAKECDVSKSMLYHYFARKEDVLFEILRQHLERIRDSLAELNGSDASDDPDADFRRFVETYLEKSNVSRASHVVALDDRRYLTDEQKVKIKKLEREILEVFSKLLRKINDSYTDAEYRSHSLLLMGMINWVELWYRRTGKISPNSLYGMITKLFLHGFAK